jgi:hypothetical protein
VPPDGLRTFLAVLEVCRPAFTPAAFALFVILVRGWIQAPGRHAISQCVLAAGVAGVRDHTAFYRFFSRGTWSPDDLGKRLFAAVLPWLPPDLLIALVIDDTLAQHKGPKIFGLGTHLDAVRSTKRTKVFAFGHVWVVLALVVPVPFARRSFALPVLVRLYRTAADCARKGIAHRKKTELAHDMLAVVRGWVVELAPARALALAIDNGYANRTVLHDRPADLVVTGAMRPDAALTDATGAKTSPATVAADLMAPWQRVEAWLYGRLRTVECKTLVATWDRVGGPTPLRIVLVRCVRGTLPLRVFFCTEATASVRAVLEWYAGTRWPIEVTNYDVKQWLGLADAAARVEAAVLRVAPFVFLLHSLLVLWALEVRLTPAQVVAFHGPWYRHKAHVAFGDILQAARKTLAQGDLDAARAAREVAAAAAGARLPCAPRAPPRRHAA